MATVVKPWVKSAKKYTLIGLGVLALFLTLNHFGLLSKVFKKSVVVAAVDLPTAPANAKTVGLKFYPLPTSTPSSINSIIPTLEFMAWNSQMGLIYANGGNLTTQGSLMEKYGIKLKLVRQDDGSQSATNLIKFAKAYHDNPTTATGTSFYICMGDGYPQALAKMNKELLAIDNGKGDYAAEVVFAVGRSNGEDALMAPASWRSDPQKARGSLISTVILDGDANIVYSWAAANSIPLNTDEKTYDPNAINFVNAENNDFIKSGERYIIGKPVTLKLIKDGKATKDTDVVVNAVSTWSPADYNIATQKGGLVRIVSTHEYASQMPGVVITIKKFAEDHRQYIENMIHAVSAGSDQVKSFSVALDKASELSAKVYNEKDGDFWKKLDLGYTITDKQGLQVDIGGSAQYNLADNLNLFGLSQGSSNIYASVYKIFSDYDLSLYPERFKDSKFIPFEQAVDLSYLQDVMKDNTSPITSATTQTYTTTDKIGQRVSERSWHIEFASGSAILTPSGEQTATDLYNTLVQNVLKVEIDGFTDNTGDPTLNQQLSLARANAIKIFLQRKAPNSFPDTRFIVNGYGSAQPVGDNNTAAGRQANRRVEIILGTN